MKIRPLDNETEQDFLIRAKNEITAQFKDECPSEVARQALADVLWKQRLRIRNAGEEFPKKVSIRHLQPGLVRYEYMNGGKGMTILVTRAYMDQVRDTMIGKPIINRTHRDLPNNPIAKGEGDGIVIAAYNNPADGWDWVDALVWDEETVQNIRNGYEPSCQHEITNVGPAGMDRGIPYDAVALDGFYEHIAIVPKGRYEGVLILMNSKAEGGSTMKLKFWPFNKDKGEKAANSVEMDTEKATLEVDGKDVPLEAAVTAYQEKLKNEAAIEAAKNAAPTKLTDQDMILVGDKQVSVADLKAAFALKSKNEADDAAKKKKDDDEAAEKEKAKNAEEEAAKKKKEDEEAEEKEKAKNSAADLAAAAAARRKPMDFTEPQSLQERAAKGREMFGSNK